VRPDSVGALAANLESERLKEIQALAAKGGTPSADALQKLAFLQAALVAVREEIDCTRGQSWRRI
jgi:hypothetical protein